MVEYTTGGRTAQADAILFGSGERLGIWEAFTLLFYTKRAASGLLSLECGQEVIVGRRTCAVVTRILRATKPVGKADEGKTQYCHYALLKVSGAFELTTLIIHSLR